MSNSGEREADKGSNVFYKLALECLPHSVDLGKKSPSQATFKGVQLHLWRSMLLLMSWASTPVTAHGTAGTNVWYVVDAYTKCLLNWMDSPSFPNTTLKLRWYRRQQPLPWVSTVLAHLWLHSAALGLRPPWTHGAAFPGLGA